MSPRIIGANLVVRIRSFYREKAAMFFSIAFPIILVLVFGTIFMKGDDRIRDLHVQDLDQTAESKQLLEFLTASKMFTIIPVDPGADAPRHFRKNKLNLLLIIPKGYGQTQEVRTVQQDATASVRMTYLYDPSSTSVDSKMHILDVMVGKLNQALSGAEPFIRLDRTSILDRKYRFIEFFVPGIIAMAVMTASMSGTLNVNAELRQRGVLRKLCATPITHTDWILSDALYQVILGAISTTSILLVSYAVFDVSLQINAWLPVFVVLDVFAFVGIGMILTRVAKDAESATAAGNVIMFPVMFLSGTFFPVEMMPWFLQRLARALPLYYVNEGLRASMVFVDHGSALRHAAAIGAIAAVVFLVGIRATRWEESA